MKEWLDRFWRLPQFERGRRGEAPCRHCLRSSTLTERGRCVGAAARTCFLELEGSLEDLEALTAETGLDVDSDHDQGTYGARTHGG